MSETKQKLLTAKIEPKKYRIMQTSVKKYNEVFKPKNKLTITSFINNMFDEFISQMNQND
jgi:hypothetical protein